ncbi:hypothetical protein BKA56DRAFT_68807 [Ilyonectria sp. MPI-CAGE-AT-0026]|nr:hypothetical protein BKA56DRAFT_68807 [Ilyonectria sp. MPI-CAGE-AT-0026]
MSILLNTYVLTLRVLSTTSITTPLRPHITTSVVETSGPCVEEALYGLCQLQTVSSIARYSVALRASSRACTIF